MCAPSAYQERKGQREQTERERERERDSEHEEERRQQTSHLASRQICRAANLKRSGHAAGKGQAPKPTVQTCQDQGKAE